MQLKNKRILVTGSSGVIGRVLVGRLVQTGAEVLGIDIVADRHPLKGARYLTADLAMGTPKIAIDFAPEAVFHLAASFERTVEVAGYWKTVFDNDVQASHRLLEALESLSSLQIFLFASSYLNYSPDLYLNVPNIRMLNESDQLLPRNLVGLAKYYVDRELDFLRTTEGFRAVSARIYRVYGRGSRDVISRWVRAALAGEVLTVFGKTNRFDYIYADDVAEGLARLAEADDVTGAVNLGSGTARSVADVLNILNAEIGGIRTRIELEQGPVESSCADMSLFRQLTGWSPSTSLETGIAKVIEYEKQLQSLVSGD